MTVPCEQFETWWDRDGLTYSVCRVCKHTEQAHDLAAAIRAEQAEALAAKDREIAVTDSLLEDRQRVLDAIPLCPDHGSCVPHALDWIAKAIAAQAQVSTLTARVTALEVLVSRIRAWDGWDSAADGPFWKAEIAALLTQEPTKQR